MTCVDADRRQSAQTAFEASAPKMAPISASTTTFGVVGITVHGAELVIADRKRGEGKTGPRFGLYSTGPCIFFCFFLLSPAISIFFCLSNSTTLLFFRGGRKRREVYNITLVASIEFLFVVARCHSTKRCVYFSFRFVGPSIRKIRFSWL